MQGPLSAHRDAVLEWLSASSNSPLITEFPRGALFSFDQDLRVLAVGGPMLGVFGMDSEGIVGQRPSEFLHPAAMERVEASWRRVLAGETSRLDVPYDGRVFQHELAPVVVDGEVIAGVGYLQDVTEARAAERALADAEQRQRLLLEHAPIGMAVVGLDGRFLQVNPALCTMLGYGELTLLGLTFQDLTHPDDLDEDVSYLRQLLDGTIEGFETEKRYRTASGGVVWASLSVALLHDTEGKPLYFVSQILDITERKRQHDALRDLTAMLAHDLRGPTGAMSGLLTVLLSSWDTRTEEERLAIVRRVSETVQLTLDLLQNSLTASTLDAQQLSARGEQVVLAGVIGSILDNIPHQRLETTVHCPPGISCWVDAGHLVQALTNLVSNAVKYGGDHLDIRVRAEAGSTWITVTDDGPGVSVDFVPLLFDRFSRAPEAKRSLEKGSGLGLYIVRDLMRLNGGEVFYAQGEEGGAAFTLRLPAAPAV